MAKSDDKEPEAPVVRAKARYVRVAPRKARLVADQVRADDEAQHLPHFRRRRAVVAQAGDGLGHQRRLDRSCPAWNRNVRVGANSPSL